MVQNKAENDSQSNLYVLKHCFGRSGSFGNQKSIGR